MRFVLVLALLFSSLSVAAQTEPVKAPWNEVNAKSELPKLKAAKLTPAQNSALRQLFKTEDVADAWDCEPEEIDDLVRGLTLLNIHVAEGQNIVLAEAGAGCARGGQGSNGAMWLVRLDADGATFIAGPKEGFGGWLYSIQPSATKGYNDIVLGWHMSAVEFGLTYFRFDGKLYREIGSATATVADNETTITPK